MKHRLRYYSHRGRHAHTVTLAHRVSTGLLLPLALVGVASIVATGAWFVVPHDLAREGGYLMVALGASLLRLIIGFVFALILGVALGLLAEYDRRIENALLPVFDVLESIPVLAFFPVIILFFIRADLIEGAAIFIIFFSMVWNIAFSTVSGLKQIPAEVRAIGKVFGLSPWQRFREVLLPALFPPLLTGSILSFADGWNIVIVAEALRAYAPQAAHAQDLFGIGSMLVTASTTGDTHTLLYAIAVLVAVVAGMNIVIWQPLLARAERFKFE